MNDPKLLDVRIEKINFSNNVIIPEDSHETNVNIASSISSVVNYDADKRICKCTTQVSVLPQNIDVDFKVEIFVVGIFEYDIDAPRQEVHVSVCKKLFPYVQGRVTSFMTLVGIPNYLLEEPDMVADDVKMTE